MPERTDKHTYFRDRRDGSIYRRRPRGVPEIWSPTGWHLEPTMDPTDVTEITRAEAAEKTQLVP